MHLMKCLMAYYSRNSIFFYFDTHLTPISSRKIDASMPIQILNTCVKKIIQHKLNSTHSEINTIRKTANL